MADIKLTFHTTELRRKIESKMRTRLMRAAELVRSELVKRVSESTRAHGPSSPDSPPHADTGRLRNSMTWRLLDTAGGLVVEIGAAIDYAIFLELGTVHMAARPFIGPVLDDLWPTLERMLTRP